MQREGINENNASPEDFLCDFCMNHWTEQSPMVEGHRGSLICAKCLTDAYREIVYKESGVPLAEGTTCRLCLSPTDDPTWGKAECPEARACRKCIRQSTAVLEKDKEFGWKRPAE